MNPLIPASYGLNSIITLFLSLLFLIIHEDFHAICHVGIKWDTSDWTPIASERKLRGRDKINRGTRLLGWDISRWTVVEKTNRRISTRERLAVIAWSEVLQIMTTFCFSCLNFWDEACWFLSLRCFGLLSSSLLLFPELLRRQSSEGCRFNPHYRRVIYRNT